MQYLKRNTKYSILAFLVIVLSITISIATHAKTEVYFSLYDNPQKAIIRNINQVQTFINIEIYIFPPPTQKIIDLPFMSFPRTRESIILREELGGFKDLKGLSQLPELLNLNWKEWIQKEIVINIQ